VHKKNYFPEDFNVNYLSSQFPLQGSCLQKNPIPHDFCKKEIAPGAACFFDSRLLHWGPACDEKHLALFHNYLTPKYMPHHKASVIQIRGDDLLRLIHFSKQTKTVTKNLPDWD